MSIKITMIGAGSTGFSLGIARELLKSDLLRNARFVLMDISPERLDKSYDRIMKLSSDYNASFFVEKTLDPKRALENADFVITSFAPHRQAFWASDIEIAGKHGVELLQGENGGPAGQIHGLRNITILMNIVEDMKQLCPAAWLLNFTNPMSMLCTYLYKHTSIKSLGFCHQVHGSVGVIAEMLGMEPGGLEVISAGINHMNFLLDIRRKGSGESFIDEFFERVKKNPYWQKVAHNIPEQVFTREFLNTFGLYPIGYDTHICEYIPFFYTPKEWKKIGYESALTTISKLESVQKNVDAKGTIDDVEIKRMLGKDTFPFPADPAGEYYKETPVEVMESLLTNTPKYLDAMVVQNQGSVANLPYDAVVDIPVVIVGGKARGISVGELPLFAAELCRRQIVIHELVAQAAIEGDRQLFLQALCLDAHTTSLNQARSIMGDYLNKYQEYLPQFSHP
jgi:alpha-galactosidase